MSDDVIEKLRIDLENTRAAAKSLAEDNLELIGKLGRLDELLNTPEMKDFLKGVELEAAHQRQRWGDEHDRNKNGVDWMFLFGHLSGKAVQAAKAGDQAKALHHAITAGAVCANFHRLISREPDLIVNDIAGEGEKT